MVQAAARAAAAFCYLWAGGGRPGPVVGYWRRVAQLRCTAHWLARLIATIPRVAKSISTANRSTTWRQPGNGPYPLGPISLSMLLWFGSRDYRARALRYRIRQPIATE